MAGLLACSTTPRRPRPGRCPRRPRLHPTHCACNKGVSKPTGARQERRILLFSKACRYGVHDRSRTGRYALFARTGSQSAPSLPASTPSGAASDQAADTARRAFATCTNRIAGGSAYFIGTRSTMWRARAPPREAAGGSLRAKKAYVRAKHSKEGVSPPVIHWRYVPLPTTSPTLPGPSKGAVWAQGRSACSACSACGAQGCQPAGREGVAPR